jgi:putative thioredoxin
VSQPSLPLRGAVDLGALASQREAEQRRETAMSGAPSGVVVDVTTATFERDVIVQSQTVPVVLDLWATWCGPCKTLSPILETLAAEYAGRFVLAKVDVDAEQQIAAAFQVQSIPSVFAVLGGQPLPLFQGALPEPQVRAYIDELLRVAAENGITGSVSTAEEPANAADGPEDTEPPADPRFTAAYDAIEAGDWAAAADAYRAVLAATPGDVDAQAGVALCEMQLRLERGDETGALRDADVAAAAGDWGRAFAALIAEVKATSGDDRDRARERLVALFAVAGDDPEVAPARVALASALF